MNFPLFVKIHMSFVMHKLVLEVQWKKKLYFGLIDYSYLVAKYMVKVETHLLYRRMPKCSNNNRGRAGTHFCVNKFILHKHLGGILTVFVT